MSAIKESFGSGGGGLAVADRDGVSLAIAMRDMADDLAALNAALGLGATDPVWLTAEAVAAHAWAGTARGVILAVEGTTATSAGPKALQQSGTPSAGEVTVSYALGVPSLLFNATDAVTVASVLFMPFDVDAQWLTGETVTSHVWTGPGRGIVVSVEGTTGTSAGVKELQRSATPSAGDVRLQYTAGVPTLTFNTADAITVAAILFIPFATREVAWLDAETVTTNVWTADGKGDIVAVEGVTGSSVGIKTVQESASPSAGEVTLSFAAGVPTLTFEATDAITVADILFLPFRPDVTLLTTKG